MQENEFEQFITNASAPASNGIKFLDIVSYNTDGMSGMPLIGRMVKNFKADFAGFQESFHDSCKILRTLKTLVGNDSVIIHQARHHSCTAKRE